MTDIYSACNEIRPKTGLSLSPLLVILFVVSYAILAMVVIEQGRTIQTQRVLVKEMLKDSAQLADLKGKLARGEYGPSGDKPAASQPRKEAGPQHPGKAQPKTPATREPRRQGRSEHPLKQVPERPAADKQDVRRATIKI